MLPKVSFILPLISTLLSQVHGLYVPEVEQSNHTVTVNAQHLDKRFDNTRFTFYDAGLGACGKTNSNSDWIVALNAEQWNGGSNCWKMITINYGGKTAVAQITDLCPSCSYGALDLSRGLFDHFANEDLGVIYGQWWFNQGGNSDSGNGNNADHDQQAEPTKTTEQQQQQPTTTAAPPPPPTTTSSPPPPPPTTTSTTSTSTSTPPPPTTTSASSSSSATSSATSSSASTTPTPDAINGAIEHLMLALGQLGGVVAAGASVPA
ncbi:hypothetical protein VNI00_008254 [Paramarasmius palmivorus]|uniref:Uncharacterized protein n=1 Tax=Paramarasmius palmivorus TaxID=297713 RepID=A0AAW0CZD1_9AGAR